MKSKLLILVSISVLVIYSCNSDPYQKVYRTTSDEYASDSGHFIAKFPSEPKVTVIENQLGLDKFNIYHFQSNLGANKSFTIEFVDYPKHLVESQTSKQILTQGVTNLINKLGKSFHLQSQTTINQHGLEGEYFVIEIADNNQQQDAYIEGVLFFNNPRIYTVLYYGQSDNRVEEFIKSFRLKK